MIDWQRPFDQLSLMVALTAHHMGMGHHSLVVSLEKVTICLDWVPLRTAGTCRGKS